MAFTFPFVVGKRKWTEKPDAASIRDICQQLSHYVKREATIDELFKFITNGRCWRAGILKDNPESLRKENFIGAQVFALDFDTCDTEPQAMVEYCKSLGIAPTMWYWSFSQGGKKPKNNYRILWVLDNPIAAEDYEDLYKAVLNDTMLASADKATKDISRLWFGTCNGGEIISYEPIAYKSFDIFPRNVSITEQKKQTERTFYQGQTVSDFIITNDTDTVDWDNALRGVCDLWDKWVNKKYLHYTQRLLLFTELKCLKYPEDKKTSILDKIMVFYDAELYKGSKCNRSEISYFLSNKTSNNVQNKIVNFNGVEYTISEYFHSGVYEEKLLANEGERITREELQKRADEIIPNILATDGIHYIECQTEAGKTERIINYLCQIDFTREKIIYSVPTYKLINEFKGRLERKGFNMAYIHYPQRIDYSEDDLLLLDAGFPDGVATTPEMLERKKELQKLNDKEQTGLFLITHACLTHLRQFRVSEVIIDENIEDCIIDRNEIPLDKFGALNVYVDKQAREELNKLTDIIVSGNPQDDITGLFDREVIFNNIDYKRLIQSDTFRNDYGTMYPIGKLRYADKMLIGCDRFGNRYLYFEIQSKLLTIAIAENIRVKLFTGTPKLTQLKAGLPQEIIEHIETKVIERAKPLGHIYQFKQFKGSKSSLSKAETWKQIIAELEDNGVDWHNTNTLTLLKYVDKAREYGFKIPQTIDKEDMYIENCAGLDCIKGQNLIVIGKADKPKESY